eukprot:71917-Amphidinium_carterae.1
MPLDCLLISFDRVYTLFLKAAHATLVLLPLHLSFASTSNGGHKMTESAIFLGTDMCCAAPWHSIHVHGEVLGGRPMIMGGASLGGGIAMDFATTYPEDGWANSG